MMNSLQKKTKIIATIGPASNSPAVIETLLLQGVDVFRLNFSHGSHEFHNEAIETIKKQCKITNRTAGILADLQGPKLRVRRTVEDFAVPVHTGSTVTVTNRDILSTDTIISIDYPNLALRIKSGQLIMINDGAIRLEVDSIDSSGDIHCTVLSGGTYSSHKGVNIPDVYLGIAPLTEKDYDDLSFILEKDIQFIAMSFVRTGKDLEILKNIIREKRKNIKVIAKIEKPEAARAIDEILEGCDGIMIARGDLGVETSPWQVPILQKDLVEKANQNAKLVIVATQMLESMIHNPLPTRAESSDIANAIIDGTDAIMLSGETAVGSFPAQAVDMMKKIASVTESSHYLFRDIVNLSIKNYPPFSICEAAVLASRDLGNIPICVLTISGETAFYLAKLRSKASLFAFSPDIQIIKMLSLAWNTAAFLLPFENNISILHSKAEKILEDEGFVKKGEMIAILSGTIPVQGATDSLRIKKAGYQE
ncbi:MAG TPA: pyruvate kinase [Chitinispirillaceae bacterium]|nr:pyruvate kinase [Chitinispirillaceae bacterium]